MAKVKDNNNNKRNSTHSTLRMCHEIGVNSKSDHFWSHPSFKQSSIMNDLLVKEINSSGGKKSVYMLYTTCVKLELDPVFNFCLQSLIALFL